MKKVTLLLALASVVSVAMANQADPINGTLLSVGTLKASDGTVAQFAKYKRPDGHVCQEYLKQLSTHQDDGHTVTDITKGTHCDDDRPLS